MDAVFPAAAFLSAFLGTRRSLGWGFAAVLAVGYLNGVVRANFLGVFTTFMFDAAMGGLYAGFLLGSGHRVGEVLDGPAGRFVLFLIGWPVLLTLVPVNDPLVQLVALRATIWFLPALLIATRLTGSDLCLLARALAGLNLMALAVGVYLYQYGINTLYPLNPVTYLMYQSNDVAGSTHHRIPSTFMNAHGYGGTMLLTLPFLLDRVFSARAGKWDRVLAAAGVVAAAGGMLMCAARQPIVMFGVAAPIAWVCTRFNPVVGVAAAGLLAACGVAAATDERLQRAASLGDTASVAGRMHASANESFFELVVAYPGGAGMGSSVGTSMPYFLQDRAPEPIGMENEFCRILIDQGWFGLGLWLAFLGWLYCRPPPLRLGTPWGIGVILMYALTTTNWLTAFIGVGTLSSVPGALLLLTQMGVVIRARDVAARPPAGGPL